jgi:hypothetical protein
VSRQLDLDDLEDALKRGEIRGIACVERQSICRSRRGDEQVREACPARLSSCPRGSKNSTVHTCRIRIERQRIPGGRRPLQAILSSSALVFIFGCMWAGSEFGQRHRSNCGFIRKLISNDLVVIDQHGRVQNTATRLSHKGEDQLLHRYLNGIARHRSGGLSLQHPRWPREVRSDVA